MARETQLEISSVRRALEIVSERWTFLVLHDCWQGSRRFDDFHRRLGIPRATLAARLKHLATERLLEKVSHPGAAGRFDYVPTERGDDMFRPMAVVMHWGDRWLSGPEGPPRHLFHTSCGQATHAEVACSHCRETIRTTDVAYRPGPGAGREPRPSMQITRRSPGPDRPTVARANSVARTMRIIGDRWSFLLIREGFFGRRRFDEVRKTLGIASNILSARLKMLVDEGIFERRPYAVGGRRMEYRFTAKGRDLYHTMLAFMAWGDTWIAGAAGRPTILRHHGCGHDFVPLVVCHHCRAKINAGDMEERDGPGPSSSMEKRRQPVVTAGTDPV